MKLSMSRKKVMIPAITATGVHISLQFPCNSTGDDCSIPKKKIKVYKDLPTSVRDKLIKTGVSIAKQAVQSADAEISGVQRDIAEAVRNTKPVAKVVGTDPRSPFVTRKRPPTVNDIIESSLTPHWLEHYRTARNLTVALILNCEKLIQTTMETSRKTGKLPGADPEDLVKLGRSIVYVKFLQDIVVSTPHLDSLLIAAQMVQDTQSQTKRLANLTKGREMTKNEWIRILTPVKSSEKVKATPPVNEQYHVDRTRRIKTPRVKRELFPKTP